MHSRKLYTLLTGFGTSQPLSPCHRADFPDNGFSFVRDFAVWRMHIHTNFASTKFYHNEIFCVSRKCYWSGSRLHNFSMTPNALKFCYFAATHMIVMGFNTQCIIQTLKFDVMSPLNWTAVRKKYPRKPISGVGGMRR